MRCDTGCARSAVRVKHDVAGIGTRFDDAFEQPKRFLGRVANTFFGRCDRDVIPCGADPCALILVCVLAFLVESVFVPVFPSFGIGVGVHLFDLLVGQRMMLWLELVVFESVEQDHVVVVLPNVLYRVVGHADLVHPCDLVAEPVLSEYLVQDEPDMRRRSPVAVVVERASGF